MIRVLLRFHSELSFFLSDKHREEAFEASFHITRSAKDLIESYGIPHVEIGMIEVNGSPVGFDYLVQNRDSIVVLPTSGGLPGSIRFIADIHLKTLVRRLRMLGFDTAYDPAFDDRALAECSRNENRVLLTRDRQLLMRSMVTLGMYVRSIQPKQQVYEVIKRFNLYTMIRPFSRCIPCNGEISPIDKKEIEANCVPRAVFERTEQFYRCRNCGKYYWRGSHVDKMDGIISEIRQGL